MRHLHMIILSSICLLTACGGSKGKNSGDIEIDYGYLTTIAEEYAAHYRALPDVEMVKQDFLLDVRARIFQLSEEISPTHAAIFEHAFEENAFDTN